MIPIRDTIPSKNRPVVTWTIIGANTAVFILQSLFSHDINRFFYFYGLVPARYFYEPISSYFSFGSQVFSFLSFMFLHGGFFHLASNMWSLWIFGDNVEDHLGPIRYIIFYLACGIASGLTHMLLNPGSNVPTVGASGAIAGVMGAYFLLQPNARILTLIPIIFIPWFVEIPAFFFLGLWFFMQFLNAAGDAGAGGGIAWWAHIGGFLFGMILIKVNDLFPEHGLTKSLRAMTAKKTTHRLQVLRPEIHKEDLDVFGELEVSIYEALTGCYKLVTVPFRRNMIRVAVPPGVKDGTRLRIRGMGRTAGSKTGDLYLLVRITG